MSAEVDTAETRPAGWTGPRRGSWSVYTYLLLFALAIVVPVVIAATAMFIANNQDERRTLERRLEMLAFEVSRDFERELSSLTTTLQVIAASPTLRSGNLDTFREFAAQASGRQNVNIVLRDTTGQQIVNTRMPPGIAGFRTAMSVRDLAASAQGTPHITDIFVGATRNIPLFAVTVPVPDGIFGGHVLSASVVPRDWAHLFKMSDIPHGWQVEVYDRNKVLVLSSALRDDARLATEAFRAFARQQGVVEAITTRGDAVVVGYHRLQLSDWLVTVTVPHSLLAGTTARSAQLLVNLSIVLLVGSLALAIWFARRIARPVDALARHADLLALDSALIAERLGVREIDGVMVKLSEASKRLSSSHEQLRNSERSLEQVNTTLEQRVADRTRELEETNVRLRSEMTQREATMAQLSQAQKLEALGQLTSSVAHDFNNQLLAILGSLELLSRQIDDPRLQRQVHTARSAARRASQLTDQLLSFSRRNDLEPTDVDIADAVAELEHVLRHATGTKVRRHIEIADDTRAVWADADQLHATLLNIAINARDAMPGGGELTFTARNLTPGELPAGLARIAAGYVAITISDTGVGMSEEVQRRACEPFFTTKARGKGTGLGLAMARGFAEQSRGVLQIDSEPGQGTRVTIVLPAAEGIPGGKRAEPHDHYARPRGRSLTLCVDDDRHAAEVTGELLRSLGHEVVTSVDPYAALETVANLDALDLLVSDIDMPGMDGVALAEAVRRRFPAVEILLVTGHTAHAGAWLTAMSRIPGAVLLRKPFSSADLATRIASLGRPASSESDKDGDVRRLH